MEALFSNEWTGLDQLDLCETFRNDHKLSSSRSMPSIKELRSWGNEGPFIGVWWPSISGCTTITFGFGCYLAATESSEEKIERSQNKRITEKKYFEFVNTADWLIESYRVTSQQRVGGSRGLQRDNLTRPNHDSPLYLYAKSWIDHLGPSPSQ